MKHHSPLRNVAGMVGVLLLVAACAAQPTSSPATGEPSPSALATPTPVTEGPTPTLGTEPPDAPLCTDQDLTVSHGIVEGAGGSRFTTVTLTVDGASDCGLHNPPAYELRDANGVPIGLARTGPIDVIVVTPGTVAEVVVQLANWCQDAVEPFGLFLLIEGGEAILVGGGPFPEEGELPGCLGPGDVNFAGGEWVLR